MQTKQRWQTYFQMGSVWSQENAEDGEECGPLAAFGCLRALSTVLDTVSSLPHLMPQVNGLLQRVVLWVRNGQC